MSTSVTNQIKGVRQSLAVKAPVLAVSTASITLAGLQTVGGVALTEGDRVLVKDQSNAVDNGIYDASTSTWQRSPDFDGNDDAVDGTLVLVTDSDISYRVTTANPIVIGTSSIVFAAVSIDQSQASFNALLALSDPYKRTPAEIAAGVTPVNYFYPEGDVRRYGALLDGVTDDTAAYLAAALLANPYSPIGSTVISSNIPIIENQFWYVENTIINVTGTSIKVFNAVNVNDWVLGGRAIVTGDNATGSTSGSACGLYIENCGRWHVGAWIFTNIKGWGVKVEPGSNTVARGDRGVMSCTSMLRNYIGFQATGGSAAEYVLLDCPEINLNNTGFVIGAGNVSITGGNCLDNIVDQFEFVGVDGNHAHGIVSGMNINHGGTGYMKFTNVTNGQSMVGCHFYYSRFLFTSSLGVIISDSFVDVNSINFDGSDGCGFVNCTWPMANANAVNNSLNSHPSYSVWSGNKKLNGDLFGDSLGGIKGIQVIATPVAAGGLTITTAELTANKTLLFDTFTNKTANDAAQTLYVAYNASDGKFTSNGKGDGRVRVSAQIRVTNNAADDARMPDVYIYVEKNGSGVGYYGYPRLKQTTTKSIFRFDGEISMNDGDYIVVRIGNIGAALANNILVATSETEVVVEGL